MTTDILIFIYYCQRWTAIAPLLLIRWIHILNEYGVYNVVSIKFYHFLLQVSLNLPSYLHRTLNLAWIIISPFLARLIYRSSAQKHSLYKFACDFIMRLWCSYKGDWLWQNNKKNRSERWIILTCHIVCDHRFFAIRYS